MEHNIKKRSSFSGGIGFVLAAAGSAVGLGNLWRFPYLAAQYGGGIFILVYIILALTFGFALMSTEIAIGRKTKQSYSALLLRHRRLGGQIHGYVCQRPGFKRGGGYLFPDFHRGHRLTTHLLCNLSRVHGDYHSARR